MEFVTKEKIETYIRLGNTVNNADEVIKMVNYFVGYTIKELEYKFMEHSANDHNLYFDVIDNKWKFLDEFAETKATCGTFMEWIE